MRRVVQMKPSTFTALPIIISGLGLCLVSLYMLYTNENVAEPPALSLPVASYPAQDFGEDWQGPGMVTPFAR